MKKFGKILLICLGVVVLAAIVFIIWLTATEYRPEPVESAKWAGTEGGGTPGETISVLSWNIGYGGLGKNADFVLDGGSGDGKPESQMEFLDYYGGIQDVLARQAADICFLQEVDSDSKRSYGYDEAASIPMALEMNSAAYAINYSCGYVPFPWPPIGKVNSGILTMTNFAIDADSAQRIALPCPFSWPLRVANLKRCLLVTRTSLPDSDKELVLVNLHLEAYDDGEGKAAQTAMLLQVLQEEYGKGNYVIAGGDFNQTFPGSLEAWPVKNEELWTPGVLETDFLPQGWRFAYDATTPSCRLLNQAYDPADEATQYYVIDGFILSPNVELVGVETLDEGFLYSDHNPVRMEIRLAQD